MAKKMLIDATHPEETRVVVADGNKVEEFDFESLNKRQLAGNIYLAKVTRVEPSLQAAFVDYGGNRHGFLAFSEIHPDYYQIPKADRDALLAEERAYAEAQAAADEAADAKRDAADAAEAADTSEGDVPADGEEKPKKSRSRSRSRSRKKKVEDTPVEASETDAADAAADADAAVSAPETAPETAAEPAPEAIAEPAPVEDTPAEAPATEDAPAPAAAEVQAQAAEAAEVVSGTGAELSEAAEQISAEADAPDAPSEGDDDGPVTTIAEDTGLEDETVSAGDPTPTEETAVDSPEADTPVAEIPAAAPETPASEPMGMETIETSDDSAEDDVLVEEPAAPEKPRRSRSRSRKKAAPEKDETVETVADDDEAEDIREDVRPVRKPRARKYKIQEVVKVRQIMLVQVVKEERGNKGAALTTYLSLAGRYCVLMPNTARGGGISRKITNAVDRKKLKEIASEIDVPQGAGLIVRTAGAKRTKTEIKRDYEYLQRQWEQVRELTLKSIAPAPIYEEGNLIHRSIRDLYSRDIDEVIVEGEAGYRHAKDYMKLIMPSHAKNVKHHPEGGQPLFAKHGVEQYLASMFNPTVQLKSGGYIVIGITEALVAVDVNSGKSTKEGSIEDTAVKTNLEAAEEVARQAKLRDLAGLIVIDFIDMDERKNNLAVEKRLKDALKNDRARIQVGRISGFGLLEMSRQRLRPGMLEATTQDCPHCHGTGLIRSDDSVALSILRALEEEGTRKRSREVLLKVPVDICNYLMNEKREHLATIEMRYGMAVRVIADPSMVAPDFHIEKFKTATRIVPKPQVVAMDTSWTSSVEEEDDVVEAEAEEVSDEAPVVEAPQEAAPREEASDGEEQPKKKRRRRSRRRKTGNGEGEDQSQDTPQPDTAPEGAAAADVPPQDGAPATTVEGDAQTEAVAEETAPVAEKPKRSRSRSRSRSKKPVETVTDEAAETSAEEPAVEANAPEAAAPEAAVQEAPAQETPAEAPASEAPVDPAPEAPADPAPEAAAPKKRRTRVRAKAPAPAPEPSAEVEAVAEVVETVTTDAPVETPAPQQEAAAEATPEPETASDDTEADAKPKKRGWWSFGS
ncbi:Rne/Rng family ribonuclease [Jannaschia sp. M317]|uniref:Rne/Rng family ribonuclease n=1 Tax=Jannaschia sp. M317 TaxID=2867011 RepID=UPI0021A4E657|nr:Rne/Rng family ribonuclease [Jannaschia sp. M317]UWQ16354.1 Rne/Rng family ribonuclease [Jannaschia sp. M317]